MVSAARRKAIKTYIKRTEDYRKWFAKIPRKQVQLDEVIVLSKDAQRLFTQWCDKHGVSARDEYGDLNIWSKNHKGERFPVPVHCGSVGCVMGWAENTYFHLKKVKADERDVSVYFGTEDESTPYGDTLFDTKNEDNAASDYAEALLRLDGRILELKALLE